MERPMPTAQATPNYLDPRVLAQVRGLELQARLVVEGYLAGQHRSQQHGYQRQQGGQAPAVRGRSTACGRLQGSMKAAPTGDENDV